MNELERERWEATADGELRDELEQELWRRLAADYAQRWSEAVLGMSPVEFAGLMNVPRMSGKQRMIDQLREMFPNTYRAPSGGYRGVRVNLGPWTCRRGVWKQW